MAWAANLGGPRGHRHGSKLSLRDLGPAPRFRRLASIGRHTRSQPFLTCRLTATELPCLSFSVAFWLSAFKVRPLARILALVCRASDPWIGTVCFRFKSMETSSLKSTPKVRFVLHAASSPLVRVTTNAGQGTGKETLPSLSMDGSLGASTSIEPRFQFAWHLSDSNECVVFWDTPCSASSNVASTPKVKAPPHTEKLQKSGRYGDEEASEPPSRSTFARPADVQSIGSCMGQVRPGAELLGSPALFPGNVSRDYIVKENGRRFRGNSGSVPRVK